MPCAAAGAAAPKTPAVSSAPELCQRLRARAGTPVLFVREGALPVEALVQAYEAGAAAGVVLAATNERALDIVPIEALRQHAVDVPDDISSLE